MPKVKNLKIALQSGSDNTYYATWEFDEAATQVTTGVSSSSSSGFKKGDLVSIESGATYYNGVAIPSWVIGMKWYLTSVSGDRAVLGKNEAGTKNIVSPINTKYLTMATPGSGGNSGSSGSTSTGTSTGSEKTLDHYEVKWSYDTGDGVWFVGNTSSTTSTPEGDNPPAEEVTEKYSTYSAPSNALKIKVSVKPVSKTHKVNDEDTEYWTGTWATATYTLAEGTPETISISDVNITLDELNKLKLLMSMTNIEDARADYIQFQVYKNNKVYHTGKCKVELARASCSCNLGIGGEYLVRCRAINKNGSAEVCGEWSDWSDAIKTIPASPKGIGCRAISDEGIVLEWAAVSAATSYDIEYATKSSYFDASSEVSSINTSQPTTKWIITGLETGHEYFFRVRAKIEGIGESAWSNIVSVAFGEAPAAPTTWSSTTSVIRGEPLSLYWIHNAKDGSTETWAKITIFIKRSREDENPIKTIHTVKKTDDEKYIWQYSPETNTWTSTSWSGESDTTGGTSNEDEDRIASFTIDTSIYFTEGAVLEWFVQTAGLTEQYGDPSITRIVDIHAQPTLEMRVTGLEGDVIETLTSFPCYVYALAGPETQIPIGYHLSIVSSETYETVDQVGNVKMVNMGDEVYSKYFDIRDSLLVELSANNIDLENGVSYTVTCVVSMDSGLTGEATTEFKVSWTDEDFEPSMEIAVDKDNYATYIRPYCRDSEGNLIEGVLLSVYRREFDGTFTELALRLDNMKNTVIVDPHPALDYARYRIVAISEETGAVSFYDPPGYPMGGKSVIIQWNEEWVGFETTSEDVMEQPPWVGSMLKLPYNIDISDKNNLDVELVEYIGRSHPVSYYGTQLGTTSTWSMVIDKKDKETLYALRRLAIWKGDVYVREPSGSGYWANINVSFSQKHRELTIPVTLDIVRVEGGIYNA